MFRWVRDSNVNAIINLSEEDWYAYAEEYKRGEDLLARHVVEEQEDHDFLVYRRCFFTVTTLSCSTQGNPHTRTLGCCPATC